MGRMAALWRRNRRKSATRMCLIPRLTREEDGAIARAAAAGEEFPRLVGGGGGIRTHDTREGITVFETVPIDHSGTPPSGVNEGAACGPRRSGGGKVTEGVPYRKRGRPPFPTVPRQAPGNGSPKPQVAQK